jgi:2-polyprenyl-3-methyl-5-hydroxy-6-metoxy-1,4-benzoquinol methylase
LPKGGSILEAGAGKRMFIKRFAQEHPDWIVSALEPSVLFEDLEKALPNATLFRGGYEAFTPLSGAFDLVVSLGVIEHVDNPLDFLRWTADALKTGGYAFLEAPNFSNHPCDLFCSDHLSKVTPQTINTFSQHVGIEHRMARLLRPDVLRAGQDCECRELASSFGENGSWPLRMRSSRKT